MKVNIFRRVNLVQGLAWMNSPLKIVQLSLHHVRPKKWDLPLMHPLGARPYGYLKNKWHVLSPKDFRVPIQWGPRSPTIVGLTMVVGHNGGNVFWILDHLTGMRKRDDITDIATTTLSWRRIVQLHATEAIGATEILNLIKHDFDRNNGKWDHEPQRDCSFCKRHPLSQSARLSKMAFFDAILKRLPCKLQHWQPIPQSSK